MTRSRFGSRVATLLVATVLAFAGLATTPQPVAASWERTLTVVFAFGGGDKGDGSGRVTSDDGAIDCTYSDYTRTGTCTEHYVFPNFSTTYDVTLTFNPSDHSIACTNLYSGCGFPGANVELPVHFDLGSGGDVTVSASFSLEFVHVAVSVTDPGHGTVSSDTQVLCYVPGYLYCWSYKYGDPVTITAEANKGYPFSYWLGSPCEDATKYKNATCSFTARDSTLTAVFGYVPLTIHSSTGGGICEYGAQDGNQLCLQGQSALRVYRLIGTSQTFDANPDAGYAFDHWNAGPCAGKTIRCTFTLTAATDLTATFKKLATPAPSVKPTPKPTPKPTAIPTPASAGATTVPASSGEAAATAETTPAPGETAGALPSTPVPTPDATPDGLGGPTPQPSAALSPVVVPGSAGGLDATVLVLIGVILVLAIALGFALGRGRGGNRTARQQ